LLSAKIDGDASTQREMNGLALRPRDEIHMEGFPVGANMLDYFENYSDAGSRANRGDEAVARGSVNFMLDKDGPAAYSSGRLQTDR
jgi:hypothetical protein